MKLTQIITELSDRIRLAKDITGLTGGARGIGSAVVTTGGAGYTSAPTVAFTGGGTGATATAVLTGDVVTDVIILTKGTGYSTTGMTLTGGGGSGAAATAILTPLALDAIVTAGVSVGLEVFFTVGDQIYFYQLEAGTTAESSPTVIRPDDYATTTNEKVWKLQGILCGPLAVKGTLDVTGIVNVAGIFESLTLNQALVVGNNGQTFNCNCDTGNNFYFDVSTAGGTFGVTIGLTGTLAAHKRLTLAFQNSSGVNQMNFTWPAWKWVGGTTPAALAGNKNLVVVVDIFGSTIGKVLARAFID